MRTVKSRFTELLIMALCSTFSGVWSQSCILRETSRFPWLVQIWKANPDEFIGHGALLAESTILSSCSPFAAPNPELKVTQYKMVAHDLGGTDRTTPSCSDSRYADAIKLHPQCDALTPSQPHDFAMWMLESPFEVEGNPFLSPLLPIFEALMSKIDKIELNERCRLFYYVTTSETTGSLRNIDVGRCGFKDPTSLAVCSDTTNCPHQPADGLLCFYARSSPSGPWKVRLPSEKPESIEGAVLSCYGTPVGIASRTFAKAEDEVYRMFSGFANNLNFIRDISWNTTTLRTTIKTTTALSTTVENGTVAAKICYEISTSEPSTKPSGKRSRCEIY